MEGIEASSSPLQSYPMYETLGSARAKGERGGLGDLQAHGTTSVPPQCIGLSHRDSPWSQERPDCLRNEG